MPDAGVLATILLIVGLFLLALELMIPSFGMIGILAAVALVVSAWSAWSAWWIDSPGLFWTYAGFWVVGIPSVLGGMLFLLQHTSLGDRIVMRGPGAAANKSRNDARTQLNTLVGQIGVANSMLRPGGMVVVAGERFHAESPGMILESGSPIEVVSIKGSRLVVKAASDEAIAAAEAASEDSETQTTDSVDGKLQDADTAVALTSPEGDEDGILDFEIPEN